MRTFFWCLTALFLVALAEPVVADEADDCPAGTHKTGEESEIVGNTRILHSLCARNLKPAAAQAQENYCKAKRMLAEQVRGLKLINYRSDIEQFEMFEKVSTEQKAEFESKVLSGLLDQTLNGLELSKDAPQRVGVYIDKLKRMGVKNEKLFARLQNLAKISNKPAAKKAIEALTEDAGPILEGSATAQDVVEDPKNMKLRIALGALKAIQNDPDLGLAVAGFEMGWSFAYLGYLNRQVNQATVLTDRNLANLKIIGEQLKAIVAKMKKAQADWQAAGNSGKPICPAQ
jgi:hypothetical protein